MRNMMRKLNSLIQRGYWYNNILFPYCKKFWQQKEFNLDVVNLGSTSAVCAFDYSLCECKGANWALGGNPLLGDQAVLNNYCSFLRTGGTVIITLCPFSSLSGGYDDFPDSYYSILRLSSMPHFSIKRKRKVMDQMKNPINSYPCVFLIKDLGRAFKRKKQSIMTEDAMVADAAKWIKNWMFEFSITDFSRPLSLLNNDGIEDAMKIIDEIIEFCKIHEYRPVIVIPPLYHTLGELLTPEIRTMVIECITERLIKKNTQVLDYMDDIEFNKNIALFQNSYLMNENGARLFTKKVLKELKIQS